MLLGPGRRQGFRFRVEGEEDSLLDLPRFEVALGQPLPEDRGRSELGGFDPSSGRYPGPWRLSESASRQKERSRDMASWSLRTRREVVSAACA